LHVRSAEGVGRRFFRRFFRHVLVVCIATKKDLVSLHASERSNLHANRDRKKKKI
jgi:hypothetical protein